MTSLTTAQNRLHASVLTAHARFLRAEELEDARELERIGFVQLEEVRVLEGLSRWLCSALEVKVRDVMVVGMADESPAPPLSEQAMERIRRGVQRFFGSPLASLQEAEHTLHVAAHREVRSSEVVDAFGSSKDVSVVMAHRAAAIAYVAELIRAKGLNPDVTSGGSVAAFVDSLTPELDQ